MGALECGCGGGESARFWVQQTGMGLGTVSAQQASL